jgi:hypothetical protein
MTNKNRHLKLIFLISLLIFSVYTQANNTNDSATVRSRDFNKPVLNQTNFEDTIAGKKILNSDTVSVKTAEQKATKIDDSSKSFLDKYLSSVVALLVLFVTNIVVLIKIRLDSKSALSREITISLIKLDKEKLHDFYDPIFTTLETNEGLFQSFGPRSFPERDELREEASQIWDKMVENIIVPNNKSIIDIITKKSHLMGENDTIDNYLYFLKHAQSYNLFIQYPNTVHNQFPYDTNFKGHVSNHRVTLIQKISSLEQKLKLI